jgi:flagellar hook assembly protein FlgD
MGAGISAVKNDKTLQKPGLSQILDKSHSDQLKAFQQLLITKMKHPGDPLNPKNDGDFTQTLIMFNGVAQQSKMNENLEQMNLNHTKDRAIMAEGYLNREVEYRGNEFTFEGNDETLTFSMPDNIAQAQLAITDAAGAGVTVFPLAAEAGVKNFIWNGSINGEPNKQVSAGQYQAKVIAQTQDGQVLEMPMTLKGTVRKIGFHEESKDFALLVKNTPVKLSDVSVVSKPPSPQLMNLNAGMQEQIKKYDELSLYLKDKLNDQTSVTESILPTKEQLANL